MTSARCGGGPRHSISSGRCTCTCPADWSDTSWRAEPAWPSVASLTLTRWQSPAVAVTSFVQLQRSPNQLAGIMFWIMRSVAGATWSDLRIPAVALVLGVTWLPARERAFNALEIDDDAAVGLGIDVHRLRRRLLVVTSMVTVTVVVVAGLGFVGLMIPHIVRIVVGAEHRRPLPASVLTGATVVILLDLAARTVDRPDKLPVGIFTAGIGVPVLLWLLQHFRRWEG